MTGRRKIVVQAFETKKPVGGIETGLDVLNVFATAPVMDAGTAIATVDIGAPFGETFVKTMKARFGVDVAIHQLNGDTPKTLASTLSGSAPSKAVLQRAIGGETVIQTGAASDGRPTATTFGAIKNFSGQPVAVIEIVRDASAYRALAHESMMWFAIVTAAAVLLAALVAAWLGRGLGRPIRALEDAMRQISSGGHDAVVPGAQRSDEIGSMARAVEVFKQGLAETARLRSTQEQQRVEAEAERARHAGDCSPAISNPASAASSPRSERPQSICAPPRSRWPTPPRRPPARPPRSPRRPRSPRTTRKRSPPRSNSSTPPSTRSPSASTNPPKSRARRSTRPTPPTRK